jgi:predicted nucleotide-binding protein
MPTITKEAALSKLQKLIDQERPIVSDTPAHQGWYRSVKIAVGRIFGEQSPQLEEIQGVSALSTQKALLVSMMNEVEDWDENPTQEQTKSLDPAQNLGSVPASVANPKKVFVVHGRDSQLRISLFQFLRSIGLNPVEWSQAIKDTGKTSPYIGEILDKAFSTAQAVIVLMTPDDVAFLREELRAASDPPFEAKPTPQARPNVLFEAGMAMGRSADRTVLVEVGELRPFSDVGGRHVIRLNNSTERRQELAQRLESAGCPIDLSGTDWHREGNFSGK